MPQRPNCHHSGNATTQRTSGSSEPNSIATEINLGCVQTAGTWCVYIQLDKTLLAVPPEIARDIAEHLEECAAIAETMSRTHAENPPN
jgi:hypothetical protein